MARVARSVVQLDELRERPDAPFVGPHEQRAENARRRERIPEGAMARRVFDAEEGRDLVEPAMAQLRCEPAGKADGAERRARRTRDAGGGALRREKRPVVPGVMGDEDA